MPPMDGGMGPLTPKRPRRTAVPVRRPGRSERRGRTGGQAVRRSVMAAGRCVYAASWFNGSENAGLVSRRLCLGNSKRRKRSAPSAVAEAILDQPFLKCGVVFLGSVAKSGSLTQEPQPATP